MMLRTAQTLMLGEIWRTVVVPALPRVEDGQESSEAEDDSIRAVDLRRKNGGFGGEADDSASKM